MADRGKAKDPYYILCLPVDDQMCSSEVPSEGRRKTKKEAAKRSKCLESSSCFFNSASNCPRPLRPRMARQSRSSDDKKLNTSHFQSYLDVFWSSISENKRSSFTYLDCLWFFLYKDEFQKTKVLRWLQKKNIFSWRYVLVPIVCWSHWNLLILCNFGEKLRSLTRRPCMLLLDSLHDTGPKRLEPDIRKFVSDIYCMEGRYDQDISKIPLMIPKVPQQTNGEKCGIFVLYFIYLFVQNAPEYFGLDNYPHFLKEDWFALEDLENFENQVQSFLMHKERSDRIPDGVPVEDGNEDGVYVLTPQNEVNAEDEEDEDDNVDEDEDYR